MPELHLKGFGCKRLNLIESFWHGPCASSQYSLWPFLHGQEFYGCADMSAATDLMVSGLFPYRNIVSPCIGISRTKWLIYRINGIIIKTDCCFIDGMNWCLYLYRLLVLAVAVGGGGAEACKDTIHRWARTRTLRAGGYWGTQRLFQPYVPQYPSHRDQPTQSPFPFATYLSPGTMDYFEEKLWQTAGQVPPVPPYHIKEDSSDSKASRVLGQDYDLCHMSKCIWILNAIPLGETFSY